VGHKDHRPPLVADELLDDVRLREQAVSGPAWLVRQAEAEKVDRERGAFSEQRERPRQS
jgi:hypothetical protein